jgi:hypothetical protein
MAPARGEDARREESREQEQDAGRARYVAIITAFRLHRGIAQGPTR